MPESVRTAQYLLFVTQVHYCAIYAIAVWDWLLNLPRERRLIWKARWKPVKVVYLFTRYWLLSAIPYNLYTFTSNHDFEECQRIYKTGTALAILGILGGQVILLLRTYAFFGCNKFLLAIMVAMLCVSLGYSFYVAFAEIALLPFVGVEYGPCIPIPTLSHPHAVLGCFLAPLLFDSIVTFSMVGKAVLMKRRGARSDVIRSFVKEGIFYYIAISIANLINAIFYIQPRASITAMMTPLSAILGPVLACRLVLDIRERGQNPGSTAETSDGSRRPSARTSVHDRIAIPLPPFTASNGSASKRAAEQHAEERDSAWEMDDKRRAHNLDHSQTGNEIQISVSHESEIV